MKRFNIKSTPKTVVDAESAGTGFAIQCRDADGDTPAELLIMDVIGEDAFGDGVSARDVVGFLGNNQGPINVKIDSFGGSFYDGLVMYNAFLQHDGPITANIQGIAYSAATLPAMGASKMVMSAQSDFGVHRAWTMAIGNQKQMSATVEWLQNVDNHLAEIYQEKTGARLDQVTEWLDGIDDGTVFSASEAIEVGFADAIVGQRKQPDANNRLKSLASLHRQKIKSRIKTQTR
jgi:ATP-dependent Clp protease protease subunit